MGRFWRGNLWCAGAWFSGNWKLFLMLWISFCVLLSTYQRQLRWMYRNSTGWVLVESPHPGHQKLTHVVLKAFILDLIICYGYLPHGYSILSQTESTKFWRIFRDISDLVLLKAPHLVIHSTNTEHLLCAQCYTRPWGLSTSPLPQLLKNGGEQRTTQRDIMGRRKPWDQIVLGSNFLLSTSQGNNWVLFRASVFSSLEWTQSYVPAILFEHLRYVKHSIMVHVKETGSVINRKHLLVVDCYSLKTSLVFAFRLC